jgi:hypothetical protein
VDSDLADRFAKGLQKGFDPEQKNTWKAILYYGLALSIMAVLFTGGVYYWKVWRKKQQEWEQSNPEALIQELNYVHRLSDLEKQFMQELSGQNALSSPLALFVEPKFLLEAWDGDSFESARPTVQQLLLKLFDISTDRNTSADTTADTMFYPPRI